MKLDWPHLFGLWFASGVIALFLLSDGDTAQWRYGVLLLLGPLVSMMAYRGNENRTEKR